MGTEVRRVVTTGVLTGRCHEGDSWVLECSMFWPRGWLHKV